MNVMLTSVGRRSYLPHYFKKALAGDGIVIGTNCVPFTSGLLSCDVGIVVPPCNEVGFADTIIALCDEYKVRLLFSLHDLEAPFLALRRNDFLSINTIPVIADVSFLDICLNKYKTVQFASANGLATPRTFTVIEEALSSLQNGEISFPLVVKPCCGFASLGLYFAYDEDDLGFYWKKSVRELQRRISSYTTSHDKFQDNSVLIQEVIQGQEYGLDVVNDLDGNHITTFVEKKLGMRGGETDSAVVVKEPLLCELGKKIGRISKHPGNLDVDVIVRDDIPFLIEMNPRFGGHYPFAHIAGADIPAAILAWARGLQPESSWFKVEYGTLALKEITIKAVN